MIRVLLADDQALVRGGFRLILDAEPDIEVVAEAADGEQAVAGALEREVQMDFRMLVARGENASRATRRLRPGRLGAGRVGGRRGFPWLDYVVARGGPGGTNLAR